MYECYYFFVTIDACGVDQSQELCYSFEFLEGNEKYEKDTSKLWNLFFLDDISLGYSFPENMIKFLLKN